jgi:hypothetical protein
LTMGAAAQCCSGARRVGAAPHGGISLVSEWVLLLRRSGACLSRWGFSSRRHQLG